MADPAAGTAAAIANLPAKTGRSLEEWLALVAPLGLAKHGQVLAHLKSEHGLTHGYANLVAGQYFAALAGHPSEVDLVAAQYAGPKADLRPLYDRLVEAAQALGPDVEVSPRKTVVALRRAKQFAQVQPATRTRIDLGLNLPGVAAGGRLQEAGGMCTHKVAVTGPDDVDDELIGLLRRAYDLAGPR